MFFHFRANEKQVKKQKETIPSSFSMSLINIYSRS